MNRTFRRCTEENWIQVLSDSFLCGYGCAQFIALSYAMRHNNDDCWYFRLCCDTWCCCCCCCCVLKFIRGPMLNVKYFIFSPPVSNWIESFWRFCVCFCAQYVCISVVCLPLTLSLFILSVCCCKSISVFGIFLRAHEKSTYFTIEKYRVQISWLYVSIMAICLVIHTILL